MNTALAERLEVGSFMGDIYKEDSERDYDDDDEDDGEGRGRQMLGFMFGNVDDSGGLDEEYLDQVVTNFCFLENLVILLQNQGLLNKMLRRVQN